MFQNTFIPITVFPTRHLFQSIFVPYFLDQITIGIFFYGTSGGSPCHEPVLKDLGRALDMEFYCYLSTQLIMNYGRSFEF